MRWLKTLWGCFFSWKVKPKGDLEMGRAQAIVALSCGRRKQNPGRTLSNWFIAHQARALAQILPLPLPQTYPLEGRELPKLPVILQEGVAEALADIKLPIPRSITLVVIKGDEREVIKKICQELKNQGIERGVVLISHYLHTWRAMRELEKLGVEVIIPSDFQGGKTPFDSNSIRWETRNPVFWILREIPRRLSYLKKGWI